MKYREAYKETEQYLRNCGIEDAAADAWYLMEYCCGLSRTQYLLRQQEEMPEENRLEYQRLAGIRGDHTPLQHITGEQEFMGLNFRVSDKVLIPRQDTEILVEEALKLLQPGSRVLDLCTGSGCIIVSLARLGPKIEALAGDISGEALEVARENAKRHQVPVRFVRSDLFEKITGTFELIVSNPPYIPSGDIGGLMEEVQFHDPLLALDGREDGLYFYREIIRQSGRYLKDGGWLLFEIGSDQGAAVATMLRQQGYTEVRIVKDLAGLNRVAAGRKSKTEE